MDVFVIRGSAINADCGMALLLFSEAFLSFTGAPRRFCRILSSDWSGSCAHSGAEKCIGSGSSAKEAEQQGTPRPLCLDSRREDCRMARGHTGKEHLHQHLFAECLNESKRCCVLSIASVSAFLAHRSRIAAPLPSRRPSPLLECSSLALSWLRDFMIQYCGDISEGFSDRPGTQCS
jgi:hypothetical protein